MNNVVTVIISVLIGVLAGVSLLLGINNTVLNANIPIYTQVRELAAKQAELQKRVTELNSKISGQHQLLMTLSTKSDKIIELAQRPSAAMPQQPVPQQPPAEDMNKVYDIPVGQSVIIGKKDAPVTIVKFSDFQCPFCNRFYPPIKEVLEKNPNKVRLIVKNFPLPFHPNARPAAKLAMAAGEQGKYKEMMEALLENGADVSEAKLKDYAKKTGLNYNKLTADVKNNDARYEAWLAEDAKLIEQCDVRGTPTIFINGKKANVRDAAGYQDIINKL